MLRFIGIVILILIEPFIFRELAFFDHDHDHDLLWRKGPFGPVPLGILRTWPEQIPNSGSGSIYRKAETLPVLPVWAISRITAGDPVSLPSVTLNGGRIFGVE